MSSLGPAWLRHELPTPIAHAIHFAEQEDPPGETVVAACIEVALKTICSFHAADLLAQGRDLPTEMTQEFAKPSLGHWIALVKILCKENTQPSLTALRVWPKAEDRKALDHFVETRNAIAHSDGLLSRWRLGGQRVELLKTARAILSSLDWMRHLDLITLMSKGEAGIPRRGHLHAWRGRISMLPDLERAAWHGNLPLERLLLVGESASGGLVALNVEPFLRLAPASVGAEPTVQSWTAYGKRGDLRFRAPDGQKDSRDVWVPLPKTTMAPTPLRWAEGASPQSVATLTPLPAAIVQSARQWGRQTASNPALKLSTRLDEVPRSSQPAGRKPVRVWAWILGGLLVSGALVAGTWLAVAQSSNAKLSDPAIHPTSQAKGVVAAAPIDSPELRPRGGGGVAPAAAAPEEVLAVLLAESATKRCSAPEFRGAWRFTTTVLGAHPDRQDAIGVNGYYMMYFKDLRGCVFDSFIAKTGFTSGDARRDIAYEASPALRVPDSGLSAAGLAVLRKSPDAASSNDTTFRFALSGDYLVGLWRYENEARANAGFWGALVGQRDGTGEVPNVRCFNDCISDCHGDRSATDPAIENCLVGCAPRLGACR